MSVHVRLEDGRAAEAVAFEDGQVVLLSPRAFAPGAPVAFEAALPEGPQALAGKTVRCRRRDDGRFEVRLRPVNLRRDQREALEAALGAG